MTFAWDRAGGPATARIPKEIPHKTLASFIDLPQKRKDGHHSTILAEHPGRFGQELPNLICSTEGAFCLASTFMRSFETGSEAVRRHTSAIPLMGCFKRILVLAH
jgi:hypothetical protein